MTFAKYPVVSGGGGGGSGDVVGPASATNNAVALFDGTTGKLIKNSTLTSSTIVQTSGNQTVGGTKTFSSAVAITPTTNQLVLGVTNTTTINSVAPSASRIYTIPDSGADSSFVMTAGTQTIGGTLTLPATVNHTSAGSIVKSGVGALTLTNASNAGLTFSGAFTLTVPATGTAALLGTSNVFSVAQTISATTNQLVLGVTNTTTITAPAPAASRVYTIPDAGGAASFVLTTSGGTQTIGGTGLTLSPTTLTVPATITFSGVNTLTKAGNFTHTLTTTATSNSTFPAGTQTLAAIGLAQTWSAIQTYSAAITFSGGTAANLSIWAASNVLRNRGGTSGWAVDNTSAAAILSATDAGAITIGATTATSATGVANLIAGGLNVLSTGTTDASRRLILNCNTFVTGETARGTRNSVTNTLGGASLQLLARTTDTNNAILFQTNLAANGDTTDATTVISVTQAGAVTLGPISAIGGSTFPGASIVGRTNASAPAAGYVGERISASGGGIVTGSMPSAGTSANVASMSLTSGRWLVFGSTQLVAGATTAFGADDYNGVSLSTTSATRNANNTVFNRCTATTGAGRGATTMDTFDFSATTTVYLVGIHGATVIGGASYAAIGVDNGSRLFAIRIA